MRREDGVFAVRLERTYAERTATGLGAGWHSHLVALGDLLGGSDEIEDRWWPLYQSVRPRYEELARAL